MMKIHTTQNLTSSVNSTNISMPKQVRYTKYSDSAMPLTSQPEHDVYESMSFKGKKSAAKKAIDAGKKSIKERVANSRITKKILSSDSFGKTLDWTASQEVLVQSGSALGVCCLLRPATLAAFPGDKNNKQDFLYAAGHSISSGVWGFAVPLFFIKPPTSGVNHVFSELGTYVKDDMLKKMYPHLDMQSIYTTNSAGEKIRKPVKEWLDNEGRKFSTDTKNVRKIFKPVHISEVSEATLKEKFAGLNLESIKSGENRVSANAWKTAEGNNVKLDLKEMYIAVEEEGKNGAKYYPLEFVNEEVLKEIYPELNISSIKGENGLRLHPDQWKKKDGTDWKLDLDEIFISDAKETGDTIPLIAGFTRTDAKGKVKDISYQDNALNEHDLGTAVSNDMLQADEVNQIKKKLGGWLPDILVTYPRAAATIAILPFILKNVFGLEKSKKPAPDAEIKPEPVVVPQEVAENAILTGELSDKEVA